MLYQVIAAECGVVAVFFDEASAQTFCQAENDEVQADYCTIEEYPLVDDYGFPMRARDLAAFGRVVR